MLSDNNIKSEHERKTHQSHAPEDWLADSVEVVLCESKEESECLSKGFLSKTHACMQCHALQKLVVLTQFVCTGCRQIEKACTAKTNWLF